MPVDVIPAAAPAPAPPSAAAPLTGLAPGEVHVWYARTDDGADPSALAAALAILSPEERARCDAFSFARDRRAVALSRALLRRTLTRYAEIPPARWQFAANPHGRPEIAAPKTRPALHFSLSRAPGLAVCAVGLDPEIGVDAEDVTRSEFDPARADHALAPAEKDMLRALPPECRREALAALWTLKESYLKARGLGLTVALESFAFALEPPRVSFDSRVDDDPAGWHFELFRPTTPQQLAVSVRATNRRRPTVRLYDATCVSLRALASHWGGTAK